MCWRFCSGFGFSVFGTRNNTNLSDQQYPKDHLDSIQLISPDDHKSIDNP